MVEHLADVIRSIREGAGLSLGALATRTTYSKSYLGNIENGQRAVTKEIAEALDHAFGTAPLLVTLWQMGSEDNDESDVKRRTFLASASLATSLGLSGSKALAEIVRTSLLDVCGGEQDWDAVISDYERRMIIAPTQQFADSLLTQILVAKQRLIEGGRDRDTLRAVAQLSQLYGLWLGNQGEVVSARGWYRTAKTLAVRSGDTRTRVDIQGRALSRGVYEGATARETLTGVAEVLSLGTPVCPGTLECYSALVEVYALTDDLSRGRAAVRNMQQVADQLGSFDLAARTASFHSYLECRIGTMSSAQKAFESAMPVLRGFPVWEADARLYFARAHVRAGAVADGVTIALEAITSLDDVQVQVLKVGVQDLLSVVPQRYASDEVDELSTHSATGPAPWETV